MNTTTDPNSAGSGSLATTGQGEIERLRHVLKHTLTRTQWWSHYEDADFAERAVRMHYGVITSGTPKTPLRIQATGSGDGRLHVAVIGFVNQGVHHETALLRVHADNVTRFLVPLGGDVHVGSSLRLGTRGAATHAALFQGEHTNTGLFFPAVDEVAVTTAGTERVRFHSGAFSVGTVAGGGNSSSTLTLRGASAGGNGDYVSINAGATEAYRFHRSALAFVGTNMDIGDLTGSRPRAVHATSLMSSGEGSVSAPSYTFGAQTTTGLYYAAASHLGVTVGGTQMGRFHAASNGDTAGVLAIAAIHFQHVASGSFTALKAHAATTTNTIYQLPAGDGSAGQILSTRGGGILEWTNASAGLAAATQAEMEAASSNTVAATPGRTQYHPGVAKVWGKWNDAGTVSSSYNISSITDTGTGDHTANFTTNFSADTYAGMGNANNSNRVINLGGFAVGSVAVLSFLGSTGAASDAGFWNVVMFGDQ